jgi:hypothetical protein
MADSDFSTVKPVENLQNVASLTPTGQRQERKRRQSPARRGREPGETQPHSATDKPASESDGDVHAIDYCA